MNTKNSLIADEITDFMITVGSKYLHNLDHNIFEITQEYVRGVNTILVKYPPYTDDEEIKQMTNVVIKHELIEGKMFSLDGKEILPKYIYAPENEYARYFQRNVMERMVVDLSLFVIDSCKDLKAFPEIINYKKFVNFLVNKNRTIINGIKCVRAAINALIKKKLISTSVYNRILQNQERFSTYEFSLSDVEIFPLIIEVKNMLAELLKLVDLVFGDVIKKNTLELISQVTEEKIYLESFYYSIFDKNLSILLLGSSYVKHNFSAKIKKSFEEIWADLITLNHKEEFHDQEDCYSNKSFSANKLYVSAIIMVKNNNSLIRESFPNVVKFFFPYKKQTKSDVIKTVIFCKSAKNRKNNENSQMIKNENRVDSLEELYNFIQSDETKTRKKAYKVKRNKNSDQEEVKHDEDRVVKEFKDFLSHTTVRAKDCKKIVAVFTDDWLNNYK